MASCRRRFVSRRDPVARETLVRRHGPVGWWQGTIKLPLWGP